MLTSGGIMPDQCPWCSTRWAHSLEAQKKQILVILSPKFSSATDMREQAEQTGCSSCLPRSRVTVGSSQNIKGPILIHWYCSSFKSILFYFELFKNKKPNYYCLWSLKGYTSRSVMGDSLKSMCGQVKKVQNLERKTPVQVQPT